MTYKERKQLLVAAEDELNALDVGHVFHFLRHPVVAIVP